jgi:hypothetical protein
LLEAFGELTAVEELVSADAAPPFVRVGIGATDMLERARHAQNA